MHVYVCHARAAFLKQLYCQCCSVNVVSDSELKTCSRSKMNVVKTTTLKLFRMYGTKPASEFVGIQRKMELIKEQRNSSITLDDFEENDPEVYESEFEDVAKSDMQQVSQAERNKELLARRIVKSKYFKEAEPSFLTYMEKDQIRTLHRNDPIEWTPVKLSESFPALPETIKKVLRANWAPKSVDSIIKYDKKVIENWKNFKTDNLAVSPALREHLMKFRNRKISLVDRDVLEKFVSCPVELPKPKSKYFSAIVEDSIDNAPKKIERELITDGKKAAKTRMDSGSDSIETLPRPKGYENKMAERLVFTEFMKKQLNDFDGTSPEEQQVLLNTYRKHVESINSEETNLNTANNPTERVNEEKSSVTKTNDNALTVRNETQTRVAAETHVERKDVDTYVKGRISFMDENFDYVKRIKIPKNAFKEGKTYRIKDCYYDDDGEFLYRVPGLRC